MLTLAFLLIGLLVAAPFALRILRAATARQALRIWLVQLSASLALWGALALIFHSGLVAEQRARLMLAIAINLVWVALALALAIGALSAITRAVQLRARLRTSGK